MCTSCVDRLFTSGPAPCPVAGCHKTLRKKNFRPPFFADLAVEREVDVRKRVSAIFNRRQEDFESLLDWNNYLEEVEALVFDIVEGTDAERRKAEERLRAYAEEYKEDIKESARAEREEAEIIKKREAVEAERAKRRRMMAVKEEEEEKADAVRARQEALNALARGDRDANEITMQAQMAILKKAERRRVDSESGAESLPGGKDTLTFRGLKKKIAPVEEKPYDPFDGLDLTPSRYVLQDSYENEWLDGAVNDARHMTGGYSLREYYSRTMFDAFSGLGVFIESEVAGRDDSSKPAAAPISASDDVF
jgi:CDK-activating kinase assembly factor MAT1